MRNKIIFITAAVLIILAGCLSLRLFRRTPTLQLRETGQTSNRHAERLIRANRALIEKDSLFINAFAKRNQWQMQITPSGLWYEIYHRGTGQKAALGNLVEIACTLSLADSSRTVCYSSAQSGNKIFQLGQGGVETGLEEGLLLLQEGDKARFILPPHLAHGLAGDNNLIPPRSVIVYEVELLKIKN
ncbi:MAG: FKBP-type peptidyl-prolyl cis-trans isomerase [Bacteroidales bacterium]|jgi:FKBP-type peptidyl-prolyl cis-trans isomerase|nr:FKBP-type peptidyl-prolyl cis-trans isomerase [Bacteroidales bacterium]